MKIRSILPNRSNTAGNNSSKEPLNSSIFSSPSAAKLASATFATPAAPSIVTNFDSVVAVRILSCDSFRLPHFPLRRPCAQVGRRKTQRGSQFQHRPGFVMMSDPKKQLPQFPWLCYLLRDIRDAAIFLSVEHHLPGSFPLLSPPSLLSPSSPADPAPRSSISSIVRSASSLRRNSSTRA